MDPIMARNYKHVYISVSVILVFVVGSKLMKDGDLYQDNNSSVHSDYVRQGSVKKRPTDSAATPNMEYEHRRTSFPNINVKPAKNALPNPYILETLNMTGYERSIITFLHNPKSGGTTLKDCMTRLSIKLGRETPRLVMPVNRVQLQADFLNGVISPDGHDLMMGGASFGVCDAIHSRECSYFTILREPYDRMISHYFFCKDGGETSVPCDNRTIEEFTVAAGSIFFTQLAFSVSCSCRPGTPCGDLSSLPWTCAYDGVSYEHNLRYREEFVDYLVQHLDSYFSVIGLTEEYDTTLSILQQTFGLPFHDECSEVRRNRGSYGTEDKSKSDLRKLEAKRQMLASEKVRNTLYPDVLLYRRAKEIYNIQKEKLWPK